MSSKYPPRSAKLVHEIPFWGAEAVTDAPALIYRDESLDYGKLVSSTRAFASHLSTLGLQRSERVAIYLPKSPKAVIAMLGASQAGCAFVPINPVLKPKQVAHILRDSAARILVTTAQAARTLSGVLVECAELLTVILTDFPENEGGTSESRAIPWPDTVVETPTVFPRVLDCDLAAILYTSGSTGAPKGVSLSHRNIVLGAESVAEYLHNTKEDRILSLLPLSFDAGMSQLTTGLSVGATVVLHEYLLPRDVVKTCERHSITGITGVPPLWVQLSEQDWTPDSVRHVRYIANTGGRMPLGTLTTLRRKFSNAKPYLMYGLTEAFRSSYLDPEQIDERPNSIGKAIPNVELTVVRPDGTECEPGEHGELVHRGPLVALGYWNNVEATRERFKPYPLSAKMLPLPEIAVWSGDIVKQDKEGFLYFVGRQDEMIKTSGYRVSPSEIEEVANSSGLVSDAVALGFADETLGQKIVLVASARNSGVTSKELRTQLAKELPQYMIPSEIELQSDLPKNPNGKLDRSRIRSLMNTRYSSGLSQ